MYRAADTRLGREVAIKVLPPDFAKDANRLARFRREAHLLASLNHPGIAGIYGLEDEGGTTFLVLELVEGLTLAERIAEGAIPVVEALDIAKQIAAALEQAHEKGIVHRDLKPANVKLTPEGTVKVLDFGLAKSWSGTDADGSQILSEPHAQTLTHMETQPGIIMGTVAYMSPEQARGKVVDKRSDIWAFGVVLFEMLVGKPLFAGETASDVIAGILTKEPDFGRLPAETPARVRDLLRRCMTPDPRERLRDIGDARIEIAAMATGVETLHSTGGGAASTPRSRLAAFVVTGLAAVLLTVGVSRLLRPGTVPDPPSVRFTITLPDGLSANRNLPIAEEPSIAISPDGRLVVFVAGLGSVSQLYARALGNFVSVPIEGTEGGIGPFFSPDGSWLGFLAHGKVKRIQLPGGTPQTLFDAPSDAGGAAAGGAAHWATDDTIYAASGFFSPVSRRTVSVGTPQPVTTLDASKAEAGHTCPQLLPGGKALLFTTRSENVTSFDDAQVEVQRLDTGERKILVVGGNCARYVPTGHLIYPRGGALLAVPFDLNRLEVQGPPTTMVEGILTDPIVGAMHFAISDTGTLVYVAGGSWSPERTLMRTQRDGTSSPLLERKNLADVTLAPDGRRAAIRLTAANDDLWIFDTEHGALTRLTAEGGDQQVPAWTPDGTRVVYGSVLRADMGLFWKSADGGTPELLLKSAHQVFPGSFSPDGATLAYTEVNPVTQGDIWLLPMKGDRTPRALVNTRFHEWNPRFSPNGRWLAYTSDEPGRSEVYLQGLAGATGRRQVSVAGGSGPSWARSGRELFFRNGKQMMVVAIDPATGVGGRPQLLFEDQAFTDMLGFTPRYDVAPDGQSFVLVNDIQRPLLSEIKVVLNWFAELRQRVPPD